MIMVSPTSVPVLHEEPGGSTQFPELDNTINLYILALILVS